MWLGKPKAIEVFEHQIAALRKTSPVEEFSLSQRLKAFKKKALLHSRKAKKKHLHSHESFTNVEISRIWPIQGRHDTSSETINIEKDHEHEWACGNDKIQVTKMKIGENFSNLDDKVWYSQSEDKEKKGENQ